ncbi:MAG: GrpB family protein [Patescibacteria group bacterium]
MIHFQEYNPQWTEKYVQESQRIRDVLGSDVIDIQHIGSTAIPGLSAKPIIDMAVLVDSIEGIEYFVKKVESLGYEYKSDMSSVERIFFRKGNPVEYHLSIACPQHTFWNRNITFRDYLRTHPDVVKEYQDLKLKNLSKTPESDFDDLSRSKIYNQGKSEFVQKVLNRAQSDKHLER